jgi:hypothetical protein
MGGEKSHSTTTYYCSDGVGKNCFHFLFIKSHDQQGGKKEREKSQQELFLRVSSERGECPPASTCLRFSISTIIIK